MPSLRLLRFLALATAIGAWAVIVIGGYVSQTESGLGCSEPILCGPPTNPANPTAAAIETTHRVAAWVEGLLVLSLLVLVLWRHRSWGPVRNLTLASFALVAAQAALGIMAVWTKLDSFVVTAHLGVATAFLAVSVLNAATVFRGPPTAPSTAGAPSSPPGLAQPSALRGHSQSTRTGRPRAHSP